MSTKRRNIGEQVAAIDMSAFENRKKASGAGAESPEQSSRPHTGVGMVMSAISEKGSLERQLSDTKHELDQAQQKLAQFQDAELVLGIDPTTIRPSRWANRDPSNFVGPVWEAFKEEIRHAGGNVEPIKVRRVVYGKPPQDTPEVKHTYEIVFGHRRHQACMELGLPVKALVAESMEDKALFAEMDRENRVRQNLSAWEQGRMYTQALQAGLFSSLRQLSLELGLNHSNTSRSCKLAQLPDEIIEAFPSPLVVQVRWAKELHDAHQNDPTGILERARQLKSNNGSLTPAEILARLVGRGRVEDVGGAITITVRGRPAAHLKIGAKGKASIEFEAGVLEPNRYTALAKLVEGFLRSK